ncbi:MAG: class B sortase [Sarcina sp.]
MNITLKKIINLALVAILCFSIYQITYKLWDYKKASLAYDSIEELYTQDHTKTTENPYIKLKELNSDYSFWISIENTNVNYPVVQGTDNSSYLTKDFYQIESSSGTVFLDYKNTFKSDFNNIIYGHNMKNGTIFNNVEKFKNPTFFKENNKIILTDANSKYTYEVFSTYVADGKIDASTHTKINESMQLSEIKNYIDTAKKKSMHSSTLEVTPSDKLLTLVTCSYESSDVRNIVHAKLINTESI